MWKFIVVLMLTALCVHADEEQPKNGKKITQFGFFKKRNQYY